MLFHRAFFALAFAASLAGLLTLLPAPAAHAQGNVFSSSTTFTQHSQTITVTPTTTGLSTTGTGNPQSFRPQDYLGYNVAGEATEAAGGTFHASGGGSYPAGWLFSTGLTERGTGTLNGVSTNAAVSFLGATTNYTASGGLANTNTWIKGPTESEGLWNVKTGESCMLAGFTNATGNRTGSVTLSLGANYTAWGTNIGTNTGSNLNVTIAGFSSTGTKIFEYGVSDIKHTPSTPTFTGWSGQQSINRVVITGLQTSTPGTMPANYNAYPAGSYIALNGTRVGNAEIPEPASLLLMLAGPVVGTLRRRRKAA